MVRFEQHVYDVDTKEELHALFAWHPPPLKQRKNFNPPPIKLPRDAFYDKHLGENSILRHITLLPSLVDDISSYPAKVLKEHLDGARKLPQPGTRSNFSTAEGRSVREPPDANVANVMDVLRYHGAIVAGNFIGPASTLLHLYFPAWFSLFQMHLLPPLTPSDGVLDCYVMEILNDEHDIKVPQHVWECLEESDKEMLHEVWNRFPHLAVWQTYAMGADSEHLIKNMGNFEGSRLFNHQICATQGYPPLSFLPRKSFDAAITPWTITTSSKISLDETSNRTDSIPSDSCVADEGSSRKASYKRSTTSKSKNSFRVKISLPPVVVPPASQSKSYTKTDLFLQKASFAHHHSMWRI